MDLWIRSQDKKQLIKAVGIRAYDNVLQILGENSGRLTVGVYDSEARAKEVLNAIEDFIYTEVNIVNSSYEAADIEVKSKILCNMAKIFEMPEE